MLPLITIYNKRVCVRIQYKVQCVTKLLGSDPSLLSLRYQRSGCPTVAQTPVVKNRELHKRPRCVELALHLSLVAELDDERFVVGRRAALCQPGVRLSLLERRLGYDGIVGDGDDGGHDRSVLGGRGLRPVRRRSSCFGVHPSSSATDHVLEPAADLLFLSVHTPVSNRTQQPRLTRAQTYLPKSTARVAMVSSEGNRPRWSLRMLCITALCSAVYVRLGRGLAVRGACCSAPKTAWSDELPSARWRILGEGVTEPEADPPDEGPGDGRAVFWVLRVVGIVQNRMGGGEFLKKSKCVCVCVGGCWTRG